MLIRFESQAIAWNKFGAFEGEDRLRNNPKRRLNNGSWI